MFRFLCLTTSVLAFTALAQSQSRAKAAESEDPATLVVQMERSGLEQSDKGDPTPFLEISDPDVVYMDPFLDQPIVGIDALRAYYKKVFTPTEGAGEMLNVNTRVIGKDVVVLTFNYIYRYAGSGKENHWNATEIYHRTPAGWRIAHTHWAFTKPVLADSK